MKHLQVLTFATVLAGLAPFAQALPQEKPTTTTIQTKTTKLMRVGSDLVGKSLVNEKNESLGKVEDVIVHPRGDVAFIEFSGAGALNTGAKRFPVPWRALDRNEEGQFVLRSTPSDFAHSPSYDKKPDLTAISWWDETDKAYAKLVAVKASPAEASASLAPTKLLYLGNDLRSRSVENPDGQKIASMHELVVDPRSGRVAYVVLGVGGNLGAGERMIAVPWEALKSMPDKNNPKVERLTLSTTKEKLEAAPEFQASTEGWAKASEPDYITKVYEYYSVPPYWVVEKKVDAPKKP
ncbi:MAG TPA: PRC-barrel domain-containing protein [Planctomycetota bacterium]|nr:PRC-barrel domain-containing protein [Planctomycetota bacterium]